MVSFREGRRQADELRGQIQAIPNRGGSRAQIYVLRRFGASDEPQPIVNIEAKDKPRATRGAVALSEIQSLRVRLCFLILIVDCLTILAGCLLGNLFRLGDP